MLPSSTHAMGLQTPQHFPEAGSAATYTAYCKRKIKILTRMCKIIPIFGTNSYKNRTWVNQSGKQYDLNF